MSLMWSASSGCRKCLNSNLLRAPSLSSSAIDHRRWSRDSIRLNNSKMNLDTFRFRRKFVLTTAMFWIINRRILWKDWTTVCFRCFQSHFLKLVHIIFDNWLVGKRIVILSLLGSLRFVEESVDEMSVFLPPDRVLVVHVVLLPLSLDVVRDVSILKNIWFWFWSTGIINKFILTCIWIF